MMRAEKRVRGPVFQKAKPHQNVTSPLLPDEKVPDTVLRDTACKGKSDGHLFEPRDVCWWLYVRGKKSAKAQKCRGQKTFYF